MNSTEIFRVIRPGLRTTIQDLGRKGYQRFGIPVSGAMDSYAMQLGNILVGNRRNEACLEVALIGPELVAKTQLTIAITGANFTPKINDIPVPMYSTIRMNEGDSLSFGKHQSGLFAYIAVAGGVGSLSYFHSKSTDIQSGLGRELWRDDTVLGLPIKRKQRIRLHPKFIPTISTELKLGVLEGPHTAFFSNKIREKFFQTEFIVLPNSNRMGYRLSSSNVILEEELPNIWSDAVPLGGIQILPNGDAIVLMSDRQTVGGYPRIGAVMTTDIPKLSQLIPNGKLRFYPVTIEEAQARYRQREQILSTLETFRFHIT
ncbi:biotin-dependent carboxyltransferase family protein [Ornithinibacillus bavariensis]|uniref:KipI antagonist n=1 Tax=Ornithinibacillus bavariensis TaxID=545502 RepID=A0A919X7H2_9BACI|nr:biotin-dependent carboxyltransferase family protein [Ornithinibacillus bavariensis]GIO26459.1 KipI antagonist [Ornithinibacillus bavariensis]